MRYQIRNAFPRREPRCSGVLLERNAGECPVCAHVYRAPFTGRCRQPQPRCIDCHGSRIECGTCLDCFEHDQYAHARDIEAQEEWRRSNYEDRGFSS